MSKFSFRSLFALCVSLFIFAGCVVDELPGNIDDTAGNGGGSWTEKPVGGDKPGDEPTEPGDDDSGSGGSTTKPDNSWAAGELDWVFDMDVLPEIHINVTEEQWNELLKEYDRDSHTVEYIHCDVEFESKGE